MRVALGLSYAGQTYEGWQSQPNGCTVQDHLEAALSSFATQPIRTLCAGRTDSGVHGLMQVVHFDTAIHRDMQSWVRGTNSSLPSDIAVQWAQEVPEGFHARVVQHECDHLIGKLYPMRVRDFSRFGYTSVLFPGLDAESDD